MNTKGDIKIFILAFVLLTSLFLLGETLAAPVYPEPVLLELPPQEQPAPGYWEQEPTDNNAPDPEQEAREEAPAVLPQTNEEDAPYLETGGEEAFSFPMSINSASREQLMYVKGVGEKTADKILGYLAQYGPVSAIEELEAIKGIGPKTVGKLEEYFYAP